MVRLETTREIRLVGPADRDRDRRGGCLAWPTFRDSLETGTEGSVDRSLMTTRRSEASPLVRTELRSVLFMTQESLNSQR